MKDREKILDGFRHCMPETEEDGKLSCDTCPYYRCYDSVQLSVELVEDIRTLLKEQPEIVRCKECKYWSNERIMDYNKCKRWINEGIKNFATLGDWFCADGVKRDEN